MGFELVLGSTVGLMWELNPARDASPSVRRVLRWRSLITLGLFGSAAIIALWQPIIGLAICIGCLLVYLKPDPGHR